jgi:hypothetical protein
MTDKNPTLAGLRQEFIRLRELWQQDWVGLPVIASDCVARLGVPERSRLSGNMLALSDSIARIAAAVEEDGRQRQSQSGEPAYHNRLHISDALVSLTSLLLATRVAQARALDDAASEAELLLLLAMLGHDYLHTGRVNQFPGELESRSANALQPLMQACGVPEAMREAVAQLILMTDPTRVRDNHQSAKLAPFDLGSFACQAMLLQESDILASAMPVIGVQLTHQLAGEWALFSETMAQSLLSAKSRIGFLRDFALFSSPASHLLGIPELIEEQIRALESVPADATI